jgi:uncharacterized protein DUF4382
MHTLKTFKKGFTLGAMATLVLALLASGCGSSGSSSSGTGTVSASLTDAPVCGSGFIAVNVTVSTLRVHQSATASATDHGWTDITLNPPQKINLLDLTNGALLTLGQAPLTAGHYQQLRLVLVPNSNNPNQPLANSVILSTAPTTEIALATPSAIQSGIKLSHQFDVASGQHVDVVLDFNACNSIVPQGIAPSITYLLKPVIQVTTGLLTDGIDGFVDLSLLPSNVVVTAQQNNGTIVRTTVPNTKTGEFFLGSLAEFCPNSPPCFFNVVITADGYPAAVIAAVPVASNSITPISTTTARFTFGATSTSHNISGTVTLQTNPATDEATVVVGAQQTLNSSLTATIKSQVATASTSTIGQYGYTLTLPIGATLLGQYSTILPISLSATSVAGVYNVQGSASVLDSNGDPINFTTQTPSPLSVNITGGDATNQNFSLQ